LDEYQRAGYQLTAEFGLLCRALLLRSKPEAGSVKGGIAASVRKAEKAATHD